MIAFKYGCPSVSRKEPVQEEGEQMARKREDRRGNKFCVSVTPIKAKRFEPSAQWISLLPLWIGPADAQSDDALRSHHWSGLYPAEFRHCLPKVFSQNWVT